MQVSRFVGLAAGAALAFGVATTASAQAKGARGNRQGTMQTDSTRAARGDRADRSGRFARGGQPGFAGRALLRGITLTPEQQARVDTLQAKYAEQAKATRPGAGAKGTGDATARRERPDSTTMAKLRTERQQAMAQVTGELRTILTAEQQVTFDRNVADMKERAGKSGRGAGRSGR